MFFQRFLGASALIHALQTWYCFNIWNNISCCYHKMELKISIWSRGDRKSNHNNTQNRNLTCIFVWEGRIIYAHTHMQTSIHVHKLLLPCLWLPCHKNLYRPQYERKFQSLAEPSHEHLNSYLQYLTHKISTMATTFLNRNGSVWIWRSKARLSYNQFIAEQNFNPLIHQLTTLNEACNWNALQNGVT